MKIAFIIAQTYSVMSSVARGWPAMTSEACEVKCLLMSRVLCAVRSAVCAERVSLVSAGAIVLTEKLISAGPPRGAPLNSRTTHDARTCTLMPNKSVALSASACQVSLH